MNKDSFSIRHGTRCCGYRSHYSSPSHQHGLTLIELMVAIAIVAIIGTIGVPSFRQAMQAQQTESQREALLNSITTARQTSQQRSLPVLLCPSTNASSCSTNSNDWSKGWLAYLDANRDNAFNTGEEVISAHQYEGSVKVISTVLNLAFRANGIVTVANIKVCSNDESSTNKAIDINPLGAITLSGGANANCP